MAGGSGGQGPRSVAACDRQGVGHPPANRTQVRTGQEPAHAGACQPRRSSIRYHQ